MHNREQQQAESLEQLLSGPQDQTAARESSDVHELAGIAASLRQLPRPVANANALTKCLEKIEQPKPRANVVHWYQRKQLLAWAASILLLLSFAGGGAVSASRHSQPGELMYPVKRIYEDVRFFLTFSPSGKAEWCVCISERRLNEFIASTKSGTVRPAILSSMLASNRRAIDLSEKMPDNDRELLMAELSALCSLQGAALSDLKQCCILPDDTALIAAAISECSLCCNCICLPAQ